MNKNAARYSLHRRISCDTTEQFCRLYYPLCDILRFITKNIYVSSDKIYFTTHHDRLFQEKISYKVRSLIKA